LLLSFDLRRFKFSASETTCFFATFAGIIEVFQLDIHDPVTELPGGQFIESKLKDSRKIGVGFDAPGNPEMIPTGRDCPAILIQEVDQVAVSSPLCRGQFGSGLAIQEAPWAGLVVKVIPSRHQSTPTKGVSQCVNSR